MKLSETAQLGLLTNRPAYGIGGRLYYATDTETLYIDSGSGWSAISSNQSIVHARYSSNAGQSISNDTWTVVNFEDKEIDTHNAVTTGASWVFTAPRSGVYIISHCLLFANTTEWGSGEIACLGVFTGSTAIAYTNRPTSESTGINRYLPLAGTTTLYLTQGSTICIKIYQVTGGSLAIYASTEAAQWTWIDIVGLPEASIVDPSENTTWAAIQASQLTNEIKGWPPIVNTGDLDALNLWWDKIGTPTTAPSIVALSGESGITETWELAIKVTADAASEGMSQTWTYADEPRVKSGRKLSALVAIWSVSSLSVTAKLVNSDASETVASAVTDAAWTLVEVPNHTLAGTSCSLQITAAGAGTFYVVPLGVNIGPRGYPLKPRGLRYVEKASGWLVSAVDPNGADYTDIDFTSTTSPLTAAIQIECAYNSSTASSIVYVRRNSQTEYAICLIDAAVANTGWWRGRAYMATDDNQIVEYKTSASAGTTEVLYICCNGYWEWE